VTAPSPGKTGETTWHIDVDDEDATTLVTPEWIIVDSEDDSDSTLRALNPSTGDELWRVGYEAYSSTGPVLAGNVVVVYAATDDGRSELQAYDIATGAPRWTAAALPPLEVAGTASAALANRSSQYDPLEAFDARTGERIWTASFGESSFDLSVVGDGVLVAAQRSFGEPEGLVLLDPATGTARWTAPGLDMDQYGESHVLDDPARLLLLHAYGQLTTIDTESGRVATTDNDGTVVLAASRSGDVVVTDSYNRVIVLTTDS
jgi:outer membrane protein assembly factor BamB